MISFYKDEAGVVMYKDNTYKQTMLFVIERPATKEDIEAHVVEHAAFLAETALALAEPMPEAEGSK